MSLVSILITTYNRAHLLPRALDSVLKQDFEDFEVIIVDDCSSDNTPEIAKKYTDSRVCYFRNKKNMASEFGDKSIFRRFIHEQSQGDYFVWLCDDDYWVSKNLLSIQVKAMEEFPSLAFAQGSSVFIYPDLKPKNIPKPNADYITNIAVPEIPNSMFPQNLYPNGFIDKFDFLDLYAEDPRNRNIVTGATLFRRTVFEEAQVFCRDTGVKWQAGYEMVAGSATCGDVFFIDQPCVGTTVDIDSASYRGSQLEHMLDCILSIESAFYFIIENGNTNSIDKMIYLKKKMMHSIIFTYVKNKIGYRLGLFDNNILEDIKTIFKPEISSEEFIKQFEIHDIKLSSLNHYIISLSDMEQELLRLISEKHNKFGKSSGDWFDSFCVYSENRDSS